MTERAVSPDQVTAFTPLARVRSFVQDHADEGVHCPACDQFAKVYRRKINAGMAHALIEMYRHAKTDWFYLPPITRRWQGRDEAGLRYWGLIEEATEPREDGGRKGWWRVTSDGEQFVRGTTTQPMYALVYDGKVLGFDGNRAGIRTALGQKFNYNQLMRGI